MQRLARSVLITIEVVLLSALILTTRCANYSEVFIDGNIYFTDADCYARMTRVRMCSEHPGLIVRHHDFENFPVGTTPHTTAVLDYLILMLAILLKPLATQAIDLAGALISPLLALLGGWFLWWWSQRMQFRFRWALLILYAISPILVHGAELGRPDHQSVSILLVSIALCAEWSLHNGSSQRWSVVSGISWGLAIWVSAYEPLILLVLLEMVIAIGYMAGSTRPSLLSRHRRLGWISFAIIIAVALLIERRLPSLSIFHSNPIFANWSRTIGELSHVSPIDPMWLRWCGYLILLAPMLIWLRSRKNTTVKGREVPGFILVLLVATYALTIWQARWSYFFVLIFVLALPALVEPIKSRTAVWMAIVLSILPVLRDWDERLWPAEAEFGRRIEQRNESVELRQLAISLRSPEVRPFLAPWWLSPSIAYWSGQPGLAGSSHESLEGIAESARFFLNEDWQMATTLLQTHRINWVFAYDAERVSQNSAAILGLPGSRHALCFVLDRTPTQVPRLLIFSAQNSAAKLYRVVNKL